MLFVVLNFLSENRIISGISDRLCKFPFESNVVPVAGKLGTEFPARSSVWEFRSLVLISSVLIASTLNQNRVELC